MYPKRRTSFPTPSGWLQLQQAKKDENWLNALFLFNAYCFWPGEFPRLWRSKIMTQQEPPHWSDIYSSTVLSGHGFETSPSQWWVFVQKSLFKCSKYIEYSTDIHGPNHSDRTRGTKDTITAMSLLLSLECFTALPKNRIGTAPLNLVLGGRREDSVPICNITTRGHKILFTAPLNI